jgi:hypothetical protein
MKRLSYGGESVFTGDAIADAVLAYAEALANRQSSATITIPARLKSGQRTEVNLLVGPASQIVAMHEDVEGEEIVDDAIVENIHAEVKVLTGPLRVRSHEVGRQQNTFFDDDTFDL